MALKRVVQTFVNEADELIHLKVNRENNLNKEASEELITTPGHPFFIYGKGYEFAGNLRAGDILVNLNGEKVVLEKVQHEILESPVKVYNFEVEDYHTYFVGKEQVWVHNLCTKATKVKSGKHSTPDAENLKMAKTVLNHKNDIIKRGPNAGQLSRPYIDSNGTTLLLKEIMESGKPIQDEFVKTALRWDVDGFFRGAEGVWELVVDTADDIILHFNFVAN